MRDEPTGGYGCQLRGTARPTAGPRDRR